MRRYVGMLQVWHRELQTVAGDQKFALLYLCNEVMLTSKDKTAAFVVGAARLEVLFAVLRNALFEKG